jgi:hypothetical protein
MHAQSMFRGRRRLEQLIALLGTVPSGRSVPKMEASDYVCEFPALWLETPSRSNRGQELADAPGANPHAMALWRCCTADHMLFLISEFEGAHGCPHLQPQALDVSDVGAFKVDPFHDSVSRTI